MTAIRPLAGALAVAAAAALALPATGHADDPSGDNPAECSAWFQSNPLDSLEAAVQRACVVTIASTHLDALQGSISPDAALLDPEVARHDLGQPPRHAAGNADALRAGYAESAGISITERDWTVDGGVAFVALRIDGETATQYRATRVTLRDGLIWEILDTPATGPSVSGGGGTAPAGAMAVAGPTAAPVDLMRPDPDDPGFCTTWLAVHGDDSLEAGDHRRCMIAIASSYVDAEENSAPNTQVLFDPRVSKHSLGSGPNHQPGNGDEIRTEIGVITRVIRSIDNRQWTVDGDTLWIVYDGYLVSSTTEPGFYVAERFTIRDGLIWELMIAPVVTAVAPAAGI